MIQHKGTMTLETVRLVLRKFHPSDADGMYHNWSSDPEVCKFLSWGPHTDINITRRRVFDIIQNYFYNNSYNWAIIEKRTSVIIGNISVEVLNDKAQTCEVGYCLGRAYWSQGIMTEALRAVMSYMLYDIGYKKIQAKYDVLNIASGKVMEKAGMQYEKTIYQVNHRRDGSLRDIVIYSKTI